MEGEDRGLVARQVVLGELGDGVEQVRAQPVVEQLGVAVRGVGQQAGGGLAGQLLGVAGLAQGVELGRLHGGTNVAGACDPKNGS
jgi:hypothetical protein